MMLPIAFVAETVMGLLQGPLNRVLEAYVSDVELRRKLAAEMQTQVMGALSKATELGAGIVLEEAKSEHWLSRSWRPVLMLVLMGFLVMAGVILPLADLVAGGPVRYEPRWQVLPPEFWDFLSIGMGGYIGGRSLEKAAGLITSGPAAGNWRWQSRERRRAAEK